MPCGWEGNRRSGVALAMHHKLGGLSTYGLKGLTKLREISTPLMALVGVGTHYLVYQISGSGSINVRGSDRLSLRVSGGCKGRGAGGRGVAALPIDPMHLKTSENFASKCIIFAKKFSGNGAQPPHQTTPQPFRPLFQISGSTAARGDYYLDTIKFPNIYLTNCSTSDRFNWNSTCITSYLFVSFHRASLVFIV